MNAIEQPSTLKKIIEKLLRKTTKESIQLEVPVRDKSQFELCKNASQPQNMH